MKVSKKWVQVWNKTTQCNKLHCSPYFQNDIPVLYLTQSSFMLSRYSSAQFTSGKCFDVPWTKLKSNISARWVSAHQNDELLVRKLNMVCFLKKNVKIRHIFLTLLGLFKLISSCLMGQYVLQSHMLPHCLRRLTT